MKISAKKKGVNNISSDQTLRGFIVPRYFRCSGERRDAVWLWCFRNVVWTTELHLPFLWYPNCYFKWFSSLVFVTTYVSILPRVGIEKHVCRHLRVYISPLLFVSAKQCRLPAWPTKRHPCSTCCLIHLFNYLCLFPGITIKKRSFLMFSCVFSYLDLSMDPQGSTLPCAKCIFEHEKQNWHTYPIVWHFYYHSWCRSKSCRRPFFSWHLIIVSTERDAVLCSWNAAREGRKTTQTQTQPLQTTKILHPAPFEKKLCPWSRTSNVCYGIQKNTDSLTTVNIDNILNAQVHQDGCIRPCHDREQSGHHWVWNSSIPRPLQKHLLQVTPNTDLFQHHYMKNITT